MTGRGEGYCVLEISESGRPTRGYVGLQGTALRWDVPGARPTGGYTLRGGATSGWEPTSTWPFLRRFGRRAELGAVLGPGRRWAVCWGWCTRRAMVQRLDARVR